MLYYSGECGYQPLPEYYGVAIRYINKCGVVLFCTI